MKQTAAFHGGYITVDRFSARIEATSKQTGYINSLCRQLGVELETAHERLFGMTCSAAYSDRPWMRLTRREASALIDRLKASIEAKKVADRAAQIEREESMRDAKKEAMYDEPPHQLFDEEPVQGSEPPDREPDSIRIECPF